MHNSMTVVVRSANLRCDRRAINDCMRMALQLAVWLTITSLAWAQQRPVEDAYQLEIVTERTDALYRVNEPVTFEITVMNDGKPVCEGEVEYILSKDGLYLSQGKVVMTGDPLLVSGRLREPGFLRCEVNYDLGDGKKISARAAAGIDPLQIRPSMPAPDDFDEFWNDQKRKLAAVPMNPVLTPVDPHRQGIEAYNLKLDCLESIPPVSAYLAKPAGAKPGSLPAIMRVHGAGIWSASLGDAVKGAEMGMLSLDLNAHGVANDKSREYYAELEQTLLKGYSHRGRQHRETCYFLGMFLRMVRAMDYLTSQPEWDGDVLIVKGQSQGGAQAIAAAGLDDRVTIIGAGLPALCNQSGSAPVAGWPWLVPYHNGKPDPTILQVARYFDPVNFAARTKAEAVVSVGFIDVVCPPTTVYMAYNNLSGKKQMLNYRLLGHEAPESMKEVFNEVFQEHIQRIKN